MPSCADVDPIIKDVFLAVTKCNTTLATLTTHVGKVQMDISFIRNNLQQVQDRMSSAEERISTGEDTVQPLI